MSRLRDITLRLFPVPKYLDRMYPALDISQSSIKCVCVERRGPYLVPTSFDEEPLPEGSVVEGTIHEQGAVVAALHKLATMRGYTEAAVTLPEEYAYIFPVRVHGTTTADIHVEVEFAMSEHVPIPLESVVYTFEFLEKDMIVVLAYDARVSTAYTEALTLAGITPVSFVPHVVASARASVVPKAGVSHLVVDMGRTRSSVALVYQGVVLATSTIYHGTKELVAALVADGKSSEEALRILTTDGLYTEAALAAPWAELVSNIMPYIGLWKSGRCNDTVTVAAPRSVILCGGGAALPGLAQALAEACGMPVTTPDIWARLFPVELYPPSVLEKDSYRFASASGLLLANT